MHTRATPSPSAHLVPSGFGPGRRPPAALLVLLPLLVLLGGCSREATSGAAPGVEQAPSVETAPVRFEARPLPIRTGGRLAPKAEVRLAFKVGGIIDAIAADEGDYVRAGQVLARLNLAEVDAGVIRAQSALAKARRDLTRVEQLQADSIATIEQAEDARTALEMAEADLRIASFNREYAVITAPGPGRILRRTAERGEVVAAGAPIFVFGHAGRGWVVRVGLADRDVVALEVGDPARVSLDAYPERTFRGEVTEIAEAADPLSGTFEVEVAVSDPEGLLKSGFYAGVELEPSRRQPYYYIPVESLVSGAGTEGYVYVVDEAEGAGEPGGGARSEVRVRRQAVRIAHLLGDELAVSHGLEDASRVVTHGAAYLSHGDAVYLTER